MDNQYFILTIIIWTIIIIYFHQSTIKNMQLISQYKYENSLLQNEHQQNLLKKKEIKGPSRKWTSNLINIPTRGEPGDYHTVGYLTDDSGEVLPLTGRQTYPGSINWNYFTTTNSHLTTIIVLKGEYR